MAEEFVEDIIAVTENKSSSTDTEAHQIGDLESSTGDVTVKTGDDVIGDQSTKQTKDIKNTDVDQNKSNLSVEELASQLGWRADHQGDDAVDAVTYILRSKDIQKSMSKHNKDLKDQLSAMQGSINALKDHNERVYKADVKKLQAEIVALKKERRDAIELADVDKVEELDAKIEGIQKDINEPKDKEQQVESTTNPVYNEWIKDNQWYLNDSEMAQYADVVAQQYQGAPLDRIYSLVRQKVQEVFPEKFETQKTNNINESIEPEKKKPVGPTSPVERTTKGKVSGKTFSKEDLTPAQLAIMDQFVRSKVMTEQQYINDVARMNAE